MTATPTGSHHDARAPACVFVGALACYLLTAGGSLSSTDSLVTFQVTKSLVERGATDVPDSMTGSAVSLGCDGRYYSQFGLGQSLFDAPFYIVGRTAARALAPRRIGTADTVPKAVVALASAVAAAVAVVALFALAMDLSGSLQASLLAALSVAMASPLWPYSKFGFATALTAAILACTSWCCCRAAMTGRVAWGAAAGLFMAFGWLTRHEMALFLLPYGVYLWSAIGSAARTRRRDVLIAFFGVAALGGLAWGAYNEARFGDPWNTGFGPEGGATGYAAFLVSPAGSVLLFSPILLLWVWSMRSLPAARYSTIVLLAGPLLVGYAFYGALENWPGGRSYGPRYLVPMIVVMAPALACALRAGAISWRSARLAIALAALLQLPGVLVDYSKVSVEWARHVSAVDVRERDWRVAASPLVLDAAAGWSAVPRNIAYVIGARRPPVVAATSGEQDHDFSQRFAFSLDFWWLYLFDAGVLSPSAALGLAVMLAALSLAAWWRAFALAGPGPAA